MLKTRTKEQRDEVLKILEREADKATSNMYLLCINGDDRLYIDGNITFDQMAEIVDFLRKEDEKKRSKALRAGLKSNIDKLWVAGDTIYLKDADAEKAEAFILSLSEYGYDTKELLNEYKKTRKITI